MPVTPTASETLEHIASELERGNGDPSFMDKRGGFYATLAWHKTALGKGYWPEHRAQIEALLQDCIGLLHAAETSGWDSSKALALATRIRDEGK